MTIDKAIKHCEEIAQVMLTRARCCNDDSESCRKCADEHRQLAEWLKELKAYRDMWDKVIKIIDEEREFAYADFVFIGTKKRL